jgi:hypothetical protein
MNELHLTEANKADIRALVRLMQPEFEASMWERINLLKAEREAKEAEERAVLEAQMRQYKAMAAQAANPQPTFTCTTSSTAVPFPNGLYTNGVISGAVPTYTSSGTGFTSYGPLMPDQATDPLGRMELKAAIAKWSKP